MDGIIIVDKPQGWTSFDVVAKIRGLTGIRRVGHSGTLDPLATGVLPIFLGKATKTIQSFLTGDKGYQGEMLLGQKTETGDIEGKILNPKSEIQSETTIPNYQVIKETVARFSGEQEQIPPMYSAVKVKGKRLYDLARRGIEVKRQPRRIKIYDLQIAEDQAKLTQEKRLAFSVVCSKGTYIRQLVTDLGDVLGCGACLTKLTRFYAHPFHLSQALNLEVIITMARAGLLPSIIIKPEEVMELTENLSHG